MKMRVIIIIFTIFLILHITTYSQDIYNLVEYLKIPDSELSKIKEEALNLFKSAKDKVDKAYLDGAINDLQKATEIQPDFFIAQQFLASLATMKGDQSWAEESKKYYSIAIKSYETILQYDPENPYVKSYLKGVRNKIDRIDSRDNKRLEVGLNFIKKYTPIVKTEEEKKKEEEGKKWTIYTRQDVELPFTKEQQQATAGAAYGAYEPGMAGPRGLEGERAF